MSSTEPEHTPLDPVSATEPTEMPEKKRPWWMRILKGTGAVSAGPAGPAQQSGGTPAP